MRFQKSTPTRLNNDVKTPISSLSYAKEKSIKKDFLQKEKGNKINNLEQYCRMDCQINSYSRRGGFYERLKIPRRKQRGMCRSKSGTKYLQTHREAIFDPNGDESICMVRSPNDVGGGFAIHSQHIRASNPRPKGRGMRRACVFNQDIRRATIC